MAAALVGGEERRAVALESGLWQDLALAQGKEAVPFTGGLLAFPPLKLHCPGSVRALPFSKITFWWRIC